MNKILRDAIAQNIKLPNDSVYEESRELRQKMYIQNVITEEEKLSNLIYAELEKLSNPDQK